MVGTVKTYLKNVVAKRVPAAADMKMADAVTTRIDELLVALVHNLAIDAAVFSGIAKRKTLMTKDVENALRRTLKTPEPVLAEINAALEAYKKNPAEGSRSARAGLVFPVSRIETVVRSVVAPARLSDDVGIAITAVAEFVAFLFLAAMSEAVKNDKKKVAAIAHVDATLAVFDPEWTATLLKAAKKTEGAEPEPLAAD
jgi:histone H3/H4